MVGHGPLEFNFGFWLFTLMSWKMELVFASSSSTRRAHQRRCRLHLWSVRPSNLGQSGVEDLRDPHGLGVFLCFYLS